MHALLNSPARVEIFQRGSPASDRYVCGRLGPLQLWYAYGAVTIENSACYSSASSSCTKDVANLTTIASTLLFIYHCLRVHCSLLSLPQTLSEPEASDSSSSSQRRRNIDLLHSGQPTVPPPRSFAPCSVPSSVPRQTDIKETISRTESSIAPPQSSLVDALDDNAKRGLGRLIRELSALATQRDAAMQQLETERTQFQARLALLEAREHARAQEDRARLPFVSQPAEASPSASSTSTQQSLVWLTCCSCLR
jgi:hypothetical protein